MIFVICKYILQSLIRLPPPCWSQMTSTEDRNRLQPHPQLHTSGWTLEDGWIKQRAQAIMEPVETRQHPAIKPSDLSVGDVRRSIDVIRSVMSSAVRAVVERGGSVTQNKLFHYIVTDRTDLAPDFVSLLIEMGVNPNVKNSCGSTPILLCARSNEGKHAVRIIKILLSHGADLAEENNAKQCVLHYAAMNPSEEAKHIMKLLINCRLDLNRKDCDGYTPLMVCALKNQGPNAAAMIQLLLDYGADLKAETGNKINALHLAALNRSKYAVYVINLLIQRGLKPDKKCSSGFTPLLACALRNEGEYGTEILTLLLACGADLRARTNRKLSALHLAAMNPSKQAADMIRLLVDRGLNPNRKSFLGLTPLRCARYNIGPYTPDVILALLKGQIYQPTIGCFGRIFQCS